MSHQAENSCLGRNAARGFSRGIISSEDASETSGSTLVLCEVLQLWQVRRTTLMEVQEVLKAQASIWCCQAGMHEPGNKCWEFNDH